MRWNRRYGPLFLLLLLGGCGSGCAGGADGAEVVDPKDWQEEQVSPFWRWPKPIVPSAQELFEQVQRIPAAERKPRLQGQRILVHGELVGSDDLKGGEIALRLATARKGVHVVGVFRDARAVIIGGAMGLYQGRPTIATRGLECDFHSASAREVRLRECVMFFHHLRLRTPLPPASVYTVRRLIPPVRLAKTKETGADLALGPDHVFWLPAEGNAIMKTPKRGGPTTLLVKDPTYEPVLLAVRGDHVLWVGRAEQPGKKPSRYALRRVARTGGAIATLYTGEKRIIGFAVDGKHLYWSEPTAVYRQPLAGGRAQAIATVGLGNIVQDKTHLFGYLKDRGLARLSKQGGAVQVIAARASGLIAVDSAHVYWVNGSDCAVLRVAKQGGKASYVVTGIRGQQHWMGIALDERHVYYTMTGWGRVHRVPKSGGRPVEIVSEHDTGPTRIAVDSGFVYWLRTGGLMRTIK